MAPNEVRVAAGALNAFVTRAFTAVGIPDRDAATLGELITEADLRGSDTHGVVRMPGYCKRIRGDDQYWQQVESYIAARSDAQFSHSICPACVVVVEREIEEHRKKTQRPKS